MSFVLPEAVSAYFAAANAHDIPAMIGAFTEAAVVKDEGQVHRGLAAIRDWIEGTIRRYDFSVEPTDVAEMDGKTLVTGLASGTFPGSPVSLRYAFTLEGPRIASLEIG